MCHITYLLFYTSICAALKSTILCGSKTNRLSLSNCTLYFNTILEANHCQLK